MMTETISSLKWYDCVIVKQKMSGERDNHAYKIVAATKG